MDAKELMLPDGTPSRVWMCGGCRKLVNRTYQPTGDGTGRQYTDDERDEFARREAERCCTDAVCKCGNPIGWKHGKPGGYTACSTCRAKLEVERETARFAKAKHVTSAEYDGPVFTPGDRFFNSIEECEDYYADDDEITRPDYVWCAAKVAWEPDFEEYVNGGLADNHHEDAEVGESAMRELFEFGRKWWAENKPTSFDIDYTRCVILARAEAT